MADEIFSLADSIIGILKERKQADLHEIVKMTDANEKDVRRVLELLEKEGSVSLEYRLTRVIVKWVQEEAKVVPVAPERYEIVSLEEKREAPKPVLPAPILSREAKKGAVERTVVERVKEKPVFEAKKITKEIVPPKPVKGKKLGKEEKKRLREAAREAAKIEKDIEKRLATVGTVGISPLPIQPTFVTPEPPEAPEPEKPVRRIAEEHEPVDETLMLSDQLRRSIEEVQRKKAEIEDLNRQKIYLVEEGYAPLTKRIETEMGVISDLVGEKEERIRRLKERLRKLPEKVGDVDIETLELRNAELDARRRFKETMESLEATIAAIKALQNEVRVEAATSHEAIEDQLSNLASFRASLNDLVEAEQEIGRQIASARNRIDAEYDNIRSLEERHSVLRDVGSEYEAKINEIQRRIEASGSQLTGVESEVKALQQLEALIKGCRKEYGNAMATLEKEIEEYDRELASLRKAVEAGFARRYLGELEKLRESHEEEVTALAVREQQLSERLEKSKAELGAMVKKSKELSDRLNEVLPRRVIDSYAARERIHDGMRETEAPAPESDEDRRRRGALDKLGGFLSRLGKKEE